VKLMAAEHSGTGERTALARTTRVVHFAPATQQPFSAGQLVGVANY